MGRWSRVAAQEFVRWLSLPASCRWPDVGCGTGALTVAILELASPREVQGIDPSEEYVAHAWESYPRGPCRFLVADAQALPEGLENFDAVVSGLVLNLLPNPPGALAEMVRVTQPGGAVAAYVSAISGTSRRSWIRPQAR